MTRSATLKSSLQPVLDHDQRHALHLELLDEGHHARDLAHAEAGENLVAENDLRSHRDATGQFQSSSDNP